MIIEKQSEVFGTILIDTIRIGNARYSLMEGYKRKDMDLIAKAALKVQEYVDSGYDDADIYSEAVDDYKGHDPLMLARQYICHVFHDRYIDDDDDQHYIKTGLKPYMLNWGRPKPKQLELFV